MDHSQMILDDLRDQYAAIPSTQAFDRLYSEDGLGHVFSVLHKRLNQHFTDINGRARSTHHYWAENSRDLLSLIDEVDGAIHALKRAGTPVEFDQSYRAALERCRPWLSQSGGSTIPDDFQQIDVNKYDPVFEVGDKSVRLQKSEQRPQLVLLGEGSYAHVYSFVDPDYGKKFAVKRAKAGLDDRERVRFKKEFEILKQFDFPYVIEVYNFDDATNEYRMEYCDETLRSYVKTNNQKLHLSTRKRMALQFLYGINYIHTKGVLHRDVSLQNVLVKRFDDGAVLLKLSDFGLAKEKDSTFTRTATELRGTILDPTLDDFKSYALANEIYCLGWVLSFIFTGRESLPVGRDEPARIVLKCTAHDPADRYASVAEIIADVEKLEVTPSEPTA